MSHPKSEGAENARHNPANGLSNNQPMSARDEQSWIEYEILAEKRINELSTELKSAVAARDMFAREVGTFMGELTKLRENRDEIKIQADADPVTLRSELANVKKELKEERKYTNTYIKLLHREQFERKHLADELDAYNDAIDVQPWATSEPIRVLLDRVTVALALGDKFRADLIRITAERDTSNEMRDNVLEDRNKLIADLCSRNADLEKIIDDPEGRFTDSLRERAEKAGKRNAELVAALPEMIAMAKAWQSTDGEPATEFVRRLEALARAETATVKGGDK